jgi:hypothetical protein
MRATLHALLAVLLGTACGYAFSRLYNEDKPLAGAAITGEETAAPPAETLAARAPPRPRAAPSAAGAPALKDLPRPPLPPPAASWSPLQDSLRARAEAGDAAAAQEWLQRDNRCFAVNQFVYRRRGGDTPELDTDELARAVERGGTRIARMDPQLSTLGSIEDAGERRKTLDGIAQRLRDECRGYVPQGPQVRYALGEIAARLGSDKDFWQFINDPPVALTYSRDMDQTLDWVRRAPLMVQERARGGDADAAFALGMAYALDNGNGLEDGQNQSFHLAAAIANDPLQAYRWLSVYLRGATDPARAAQAQQLLQQAGAQLTPEQRAQAQGWSP